MFERKNIILILFALRLHENKIGDEGLKCLARYLQDIPKLETLK